MAITLAAFRTKLDDVVTAVEAENWKNAHLKLTSAAAIRAGLEKRFASDETRI